MRYFLRFWQKKANEKKNQTRLWKWMKSDQNFWSERRIRNYINQNQNRRRNQSCSAPVAAMLMRGVRGNRRDSLKLQTILLFVLLFGSAVLHQHPSGLAPWRRYKKASLHRKNRSLNALYSKNLIEENIRHQKHQLQWLEIILVSVSFPSCYYALLRRL